MKKTLAKPRWTTLAAAPKAVGSLLSADRSRRRASTSPRNSSIYRSHSWIAATPAAKAQQKLPRSLGPVTLSVVWEVEEVQSLDPMTDGCFRSKSFPAEGFEALHRQTASVKTKSVSVPDWQEENTSRNRCYLSRSTRASLSSDKSTKPSNKDVVSYNPKIHVSLLLLALLVDSWQLFLGETIIFGNEMSIFCTYFTR